MKDKSCSGATRNSIDTHRHDLLVWEFIDAMAAVAHEGEQSHGGPGTPGNWKNGFDDTGKYVWNHVFEHYRKYREGDRSESHLAKMAWSIMVAWYFDEQERKNTNV